MATLLMPAPVTDPLCCPDHTRFDPVFVLGHPRSGTSLTCRLLLDHLGINFGTESQFIVRHYKRLARYGDLRDDYRLRWLFEEIRRERFFERTRRNFGFVFDVDRAMRAIPHRTYAGALEAIFEQFARTKGLSRWGDKTPDYSRHLPVLRELFPTAQFLHVVRDGRDVAVSTFKSEFGAKNTFEAARTWKEHIRLIERFSAGLPASDFRTIRYEDMLKDPAATLGTIGTFLGLSNGEAVMASIAGRLRQQVWEHNTDKSKQFLSAREIECFEAVAWDELQEFGYTPRYRRRSKPMTFAESAYWKARGVWRRLSDPRYWADDWYKARLRLREATLSMRRPAPVTSFRR